jgi:hypothetical protein
VDQGVASIWLHFRLKSHGVMEHTQAQHADGNDFFPRQVLCPSSHIHIAAYRHGGGNLPKRIKDPLIANISGMDNHSHLFEGFDYRGRKVPVGIGDYTDLQRFRD